MSIVFATKKFHEYVYGTKFEVSNDLLPLRSIFNKSITKAPPRIQRFLLCLQKDGFVMHYIPGKDLLVADTLSRSSLLNSGSEIPSNEINCYVHNIIDEYPISNTMKKKIASETDSDVLSKLLKGYIINGWPSQRRDVEQEVRFYFNQREELTILDDMIMKGIRIVVPKSLRPEMRNLLHTGHLGIEKNRQCARTTMYWPGMNHEISEVINKCELCLENQNKQKKEPIITHEIPLTPWFK